MLTIRCTVACLALAAVAAAQGTGPYLNFETPQVKPIACTTVGASTFLLVCNSPDGSVEVYDTSTNAFVARVPVGQEPVSIVVKPTLTADGARRCYTANWLGDSITSFELAANGAFQVLRTVHVGDEPTMIAFYPVPGALQESLVVTFGALGAWAWLDADTLAPTAPGRDRIELKDSAEQLAVKEARTVAFSPATGPLPLRMYVLNARGGATTAAPSPLEPFDFDLWGARDVVAAAASGKAGLPKQAGLGSTNFNMAFAPNGDLYVVSQEARNTEVATSGDFVTGLGEPDMLALTASGTGFVRSLLVRVRQPCTTGSVVDRFDLNSVDGTFGGAQDPVPVTQPTDVVVLGSGANGATRVFVAGFGSDTLGMLLPADPWSGATLERIEFTDLANPFTDQTTSGTMRAPRGLALKASGVVGDASDRLYVYNRHEHSVTVLSNPWYDPATQSPSLSTFPLQKDPTPAHVRNGRKFIYSSRLSGGGNVSCASCHIDGTSDFLAWNLSDGLPVVNGTPDGFPTGILGGGNDPQNSNPGFKGPMQTQSLRGLVTFEIDSATNQDEYFTTAPNHWRGDRKNVADFNGAYIHLLGIAHPALPGVGGLSLTDIAACMKFVHSIHYPPNPEQPIARAYSGSMTTAADPLPTDPDYSVASAGSLARQGLKNFHIESSDGRSCMTCHSLPEGSNNRLTERFFYFGVPALPEQRIETAALRGLVSKEKELVRTINGVVTRITGPGGAGITTGEFGLLHTGKKTLADSTGALAPFGHKSILDFVNGFAAVPPFSVNSIVLFLRELDTGVAPIVGRSLTVDFTLMGTPAGQAQVNAALDEFEAQVKLANAELAVHARIAGVSRGLWFDATRAPDSYVEEPHGGVTPILPATRARLLNTVDPAQTPPSSGNLLVFQSTPLGSGRRIAFLDGGVPPALTAAAPTGVALLPCRANTANAEIPRLTSNWLSALSTFGENPNVSFTNNKTVVFYQASMKWYGGATPYPAGTPASFGLADFRHEPPRRFAISGTGIRHGAWVRIYRPKASDWLPPTSATQEPQTVPNATTHPDPFEFPIHPSVDPSAPGGIAWLSAVEIEPLHLLALVNGGKANTPVLDALTDPTLFETNNPNLVTGTAAAPGPFDPALHNWFYVQVVNDPASPSSVSAGAWQRLSVQPVQ